MSTWKTPEVRKALRDHKDVDAVEPPLKKMKGKSGPPKAVCGKARGKGGKGKKAKAAPMEDAPVAVGTNDTKPVESAPVAVGTNDTKPVENAQAAVGTQDTKPVENAQVAPGAGSTEPDGAVPSEGGDADPAHATGGNDRQQQVWAATVPRIRLHSVITYN